MSFNRSNLLFIELFYTSDKKTEIELKSFFRRFRLQINALSLAHYDVFSGR